MGRVVAITIFSILAVVTLALGIAADMSVRGADTGWLVFNNVQAFKSCTGLESAFALGLCSCLVSWIAIIAATSIACQCGCTVCGCGPKCGCNGCASSTRVQVGHAIGWAWTLLFMSTGCWISNLVFVYLNVSMCNTAMLDYQLAYDHPSRMKYYQDLYTYYFYATLPFGFGIGGALAASLAVFLMIPAVLRANSARAERRGGGDPSQGKADDVVVNISSQQQEHANHAPSPLPARARIIPPSSLTMLQEEEAEDEGDGEGEYPTAQASTPPPSPRPPRPRAQPARNRPSEHENAASSSHSQDAVKSKRLCGGEANGCMVTIM